MAYFLIGETLVADGPFYVLWTRDESGVSITPWGSRDRRDMQALGRSLAEFVAPDGDVDEQADAILSGAMRHAAGRRLGLVDLAEAEQETIAEAIRDSLDETDGQVGASCPLPAVETEVLALVRQRLEDVT